MSGACQHRWHFVDGQATLTCVKCGAVTGPRTPGQPVEDQGPIKESSVTHGHLWIGDLYGKEKNNG